MSSRRRLSQFVFVVHTVLVAILALSPTLAASAPAHGASSAAPAAAGLAPSSAAPVAAQPRARQAIAGQNQPDALAQPLAIARTQSIFAAPGAAVVITYTVQNTLSPVVTPDLPDTATPEEIVAALQGFDFAADPHTLRNATLVAEPTASSTVVATSRPADVGGGRYVFQLGDLPPQASATVVITATTPPAVSAATDLVYASGWASLDGQAATADAAPARVLPASFADWLIRTVDADTADAEMLRALATVGADPAAIFAYVRGLGFEAYRGSLRGTRGTLWSGAGNSLDLSSLLIAMLRASGVPARYRHGSLSTANAQTLIASMFPAPTAALGQAAPELPTSDPVNDPDLIAEVQDHWWVEAYIGGAWTDLDPSFANATVGQLFASTIAGDGTDRVAEAPDNFRPQVTITLEVETWNQLTGGAQATVDTRLQQTFPAVQVATDALVFGNLVSSQQQPGMVYANTQHTFTPFLYVNDRDEFILGTPYQELLTSFPLATTVVTGAWLVIEVEDIDGGTTTHRRTLADRLGYDIRTNGGAPTLALTASSPPVFSEFDLYSLSFFPLFVPRAAMEARRAALTGVVAEMADDAARMQELEALEPLDAGQQAEASQLRARYQLDLSRYLAGVSLTFAEEASRASEVAQEAFYVKAYHDAPQVVIVSHEAEEAAAEFNVDLRYTAERALPYPGQAAAATFSFNLFKGINESWLEGQVLGAPSGQAPLTAARVMQAAYEQGIGFVFVGEPNLNVVSTLGLSAEAQARIAAAVADGKLVNIPTAPPVINGQPAIGWWEIDPHSGATIGVMENGLHNALIEFVSELLFGSTVGKLTDFMIGGTAACFDFVGQQYNKAAGYADFGSPAEEALGAFDQGLACLAGDTLGCADIGLGFLDYGYAAFSMGLNYFVANDPPLPPVLMGGPTFAADEDTASAAVAVAATVAPGAIAASVQTGFVQTTDATGSLSFYAPALDPLASGATGSAAAVNHVNSANLTLADALVRVAAATGTVTVGGVAVTPGSGLAIVGFDGTLDVSVVDPDTDQAVLNGSGDLVSLAVSPAGSTISPVQTAAFNAVFSATATDTFTVTVAAPDGWQATVNNAGQATATPPAGAAAGVYQVMVTAQSASTPGLVLRGLHTVTVTAYSNWTLTVAPDPLITVPMGPELSSRSLVNSGQAQVSGAAYLIELNNTGNSARSYTVSVSGLPAGWTLLAGQPDTSTSLSLPPGERGQIGLYVTPDSLPPAGTTHNITVTAVDQDGATANANASFTMPAVPFSYVEAAPSPQAVASTGLTVYDVSITNVGNAAGTFGLTAEVYNFDGSVSIGALPGPTALAAGQSATFPVTVTTTNADPRSTTFLFFGSPAPGGVYTPTTTVELRVVSDEAAPIAAAANRCELPSAHHAAYLALAEAVDELTFWCDQGDCPLALRDQVVAAGETVAGYAEGAASPTPLPALAAVNAALADLASQTTDAGILAVVADLSAAISQLSVEACEVQEHQVSGRFTPYVQAVLLGDTAAFSLDVTNEGAIATTYAITVTGRPDGDLTFSPTIAPGATTSLPVTSTPTSLGSYDLAAEIVAVAPDVTLDIRRTARSRLNAVDRFVQVNRVIADPAFVETGVSATDLSVEVANIAGVAQPATAQMAILAPGGSTQWSGSAALTVLAGNPRLYDLATVNTSGWAAGVYTVTVELRDSSNALIPDGSGYGYLGVGQSVQLSQAVTPTIVAPGTVTVTTVITSEIDTGNQLAVNGNRLSVNGERLPVTGDRLPFTVHRSPEDGARTAYDAPLTAADAAYLNPAGPADAPAASGDGPAASGDGPAASLLGRGPQPAARPDDAPAEDRPSADAGVLPLTPVYTDTAALDSAPAEAPFTVLGSPFTAPAFTRVEQSDAAWTYTGAWSNQTLGRPSGGSYARNATAGGAATLTFSGAWLTLGFIADRWSGRAEVFIDGVSQGVVDLYRNVVTIGQEAPISFLYDGLSAGAHTVVVEVEGSANPYASDTRVQLDYADYGDGSALPDGSFEQNDARVLRSGGWTTTSYAGASGGSYIYASNAAAWFPFTGDSFSLHTIAYSGAGKARLYVDGVYLDTVDMFAPVSASSGISRVFSYQGLGAGPHVLTVLTYQNTTSIDRLVTPGAAPFTDPNPPVTGITRFEADHPAILYNGVPFTQTATTWERVADSNATRASAGEFIYSGTAGDTASFTFGGDWLGIGFVTSRYGGQATIAVDGTPLQTVDLYSRFNDTASYYFSGLGAGSHTVTITVLSTKHPNSSGAGVHLDFFDVWDGLPLADGAFEEDSARPFYSAGWDRVINSSASGGAYASTTDNGTAWFPFTGDSVTFQAWTNDSLQDIELRIDGVSRGRLNLYSYIAGTRAYSFNGLGAGPHVLELRKYRNDTATLDAFTTPASGSPYAPPAPAPFVRYEEDHDALRYNGYPYRTMPQSWDVGSTNYQNSATYNTTTGTAGNTWSLDFTGQWLNIGFRSSGSSGSAEVFLDGASQGVFSTAGGVNNVKNAVFNLAPGAHTVQVVVVSGTVMPDYMDVWDGRPVADGWYDAQLENEPSGLIYFSDKDWWQRATNVYAYNGDYLTPFASVNANIWFNFVGDDLTVLGFNRSGTQLTVVIDGASQGTFDMTAAAPFSNQPYALHFPDLGDGPHNVQVFVYSLGSTTSRLDAFEVDPAVQTSYVPQVKWYDTAPAAPGSDPSFYNNGLMSTIAIGDLDGDGVVELVAPSTNGALYVYRGDGQDAGGGSPLIWSTNVVGVAAEPALADINDDGRAEIIVSGYNGTFAFAYDGTQLWHNPTVRAYTSDSGGAAGWGGPTVGNLDLDPEPEIAIAASEDKLYVLDHLGNILWSDPIGRWPTVPVLTDVTGDGVLDILVAREWVLKAFDFFNGGALVWSYTQTNTIGFSGGSGAFGAPAVADLDGDAQPEIILNWGHLVEALRSDGALLWRYNSGRTDLFRPSPVTVADVTGDGQVDVVTASAISSGLVVLNHLLMVLDRNGNLVWSQTVADSTASASGVAAQDLTGDGIWEIVWNGSADGLLIIRGSDGKRLFNEPYTGSDTVMEYPSLGDVDGDGVADLVAGGREGIFVFSHVGRWTDSRPLWGGHNYHVTDINDDFSVPVNEPNSWELHNTYRTQTPDRTPAPAYRMVFTYTEGLNNVTVLTDTASIPLTAAPPTYTWTYHQEWYQPVITTTFDSLLTGLRPGEAREVASGAEMAYWLSGGYNVLTLPSLYVTAARLGVLAPVSQTVPAGATATYTLTLTNPGAAAAVYTVTVGGAPTAWLSYPASVPLNPGQTVDVTITVDTPPDAAADTLPLLVDVSNGSGGQDALQASLTVFTGLALSLSPAEQAGPTGQPLSYALTVQNLEDEPRTYTLTAGGLATVSLPGPVTVPANSSLVVNLTATPPSAGPQPFTVSAGASNGVAADVDGVAEGLGRYGVLAQIAPASVAAGPGATAVYTVSVTNVGDTADDYSLAVAAPSGWTAELTLLGAGATQVSVPATAFNRVDLRLAVTPPPGAAAGAYPITVTAQSLTLAAISSAAAAQVGPRGATVSIAPDNAAVNPAAPASWDVTVTNAGSVADTFSLEVAGALAAGAQLSASSVTLNPGASQTVQLTADDLLFLLPGPYTFAVAARSQADSAIFAQDTAAFTVAPNEAVGVAWEPISQTVTTLSAAFTLLITNTGNTTTEYDLAVSGAGLTASPALDRISLPPRATGVHLVTMTAAVTGTYPFTGTATSTTSSASDSASATLIVLASPTPAAPVVSIALSGADVVLTWPAVTQDVNGNSITVSRYEIWRSLSPYCVPGDAACPTPLVANHPGSPFVDTAAAATDTPYFYQVRAVSAADVASAPSNRVGKWGYPLAPGD